MGPYFVEKSISEALKKQRKKFKGTDEEFEAKWNDKSSDFYKGIVDELAKGIIGQGEKNVKWKKKHNKEVSRNIKGKHGDALSIFDFFIEFNIQAGRDFYEKYYAVFEEHNELLKLDTLILLHTRACQVASEIRLLVGAGYADGALARWRSLHELCVIFLFLYDNDYEVIQMYRDYEIIESIKKAKEYNVIAEAFGWELMPDTELAEIESQRAAVIAKYGKEFKDDYGWAMSVLPPGQRHFREIEKRVGNEHLRAVYAWACENVHAGMSANYKKLGLSDENSNILLNCSSEDGILDPVQYTSYSLFQMSETLLEMEDSIFNNVYLDALEKIQNELVNAFTAEDSSTLS